MVCSMKKDLITHFLFTVAFFLLASLVRRWFSLSFYPFWIGGVVGMILPDVDYLVYTYLLRPEASISQQASTLIEKRSIFKTWDLFASERANHPDLIFHTAYFQAIFLIFSFLVVTSSGSLFGIGLVMAFALHLLVDQLSDFFERGGIAHWFSKMNVNLNKKGERWFLAIQTLVILAYGFVL